MARKVPSAPITLEGSLKEPISEAELDIESKDEKDAEKAILERDVSDTMGAAIPEHPLAHIFPSMTPEEYNYLKLDIATNGQLQPIYLAEGKIIDGRHRYRATRELGIEPITTEWDGTGSLTAFVVAMNLNRRHLNTSQRAGIALRVLPFYEAEAKQREVGGVQVSAEEAGTARDRAGRTVNVSGRQVAMAKKVEEVAPDLVDEIIAGNMTVNKALTVASERPNPDGTPRIPVARQGKNPPAEERREGALFELYDNLNGWVTEYGRVPSLKPLVAQVKEWVKIVKAAEADGMDAEFDAENFNPNDYAEAEDSEEELALAEE